MNKSILRLILINLSVIILFAVSVFCFQTVTYTADNNTHDKDYANITQVVKYKTIEIFDKSIPNNITKTVMEGKNGLSYVDQLGATVILNDVVDEQIVIGTGKYGVYKGSMTGYGPDCATCDGIGIVACDTKDRKTFNIITDGVYYNDEEYGQARVLAAALVEFPCGTIIKIENSPLGEFIGIVMDTGYDMRRFYEMGKYLFDVAYDTENNYMVPKTTDTSGNVIYNVQRWGW